MNDAPTMHTLFSVYWIETVASSNSLHVYCWLFPVVVLFLPRHLYPIVIPYQFVVWFLHFNWTHTVDPFAEVDGRVLSSVHHHHPAIKNMLVLQLHHPWIVASINQFCFYLDDALVCAIQYISCSIIESHIEESKREFGCPAMLLPSLFCQNIPCLYLVGFIINLIVGIRIVNILDGSIDRCGILFSNATVSYFSSHHPSSNELWLMIIR